MKSGLEIKNLNALLTRESVEQHKTLLGVQRLGPSHGARHFIFGIQVNHDKHYTMIVQILPH